MRRILIAIAVLAMAPVLAAPPQSGFLDDYPPMQADAQRPGATTYAAPGRTLKGFDKVMIEPILVWYAPESKYKGIDPNELAAVTTSLRTALVDNLEPRYPVVQGAGPGVLQVRMAVTNVVAQKKKKGLLSYTPVGLVVGAAKSLATAGPNIDLSAATVEAELLDASGERLAVIIEPLISGESKQERLSWDQIATVLDAYGKRLRARLDADNPP